MIEKSVTVVSVLAVSLWVLAIALAAAGTILMIDSTGRTGTRVGFSLDIFALIAAAAAATASTRFYIGRMQRLLMAAYKYGRDEDRHRDREGGPMRRV